MSLRKQRRIRLIMIGILFLAISVIAIGFGFRNSIEYFKSPTQVFEEGAPAERFRIGGLVVVGSLKTSGTDEVVFDVTDGNEIANLSVVYKGLLPDLFAEGQGVIARGHLEGGLFQADEILAKHDENYMPREITEALKEQGVYRESE